MSAHEQGDQSTAATLLSPGTVVKDRWAVQLKIGGGGFGEIYKAKDQVTGEVSMRHRGSCGIILLRNNILLECMVTLQ